MAHEVFISYSTKDKPIADGVCANLEAAGVRCWIAPRDIEPGEDWPTAISNAISQGRIMVLVFSSSSNASDDVGRELVLAANHKLVIIPFKIENVEPEPGKQYYLARTHWLDAINPPTQAQINRLVETVQGFLGMKKAQVPPSIVSEPPLTATPTIPPQRKRRPWLWIPVAVVLLGVAILLAPSLMPSRNSVIPTATSGPQLPYTENFSSPGQRWNVSMDSISERRYEDGSYLMRVGPNLSKKGTSENSYAYGPCLMSWSLAGLGSLSNIAVEVEARYWGGPAEGLFGLLFYYQNPSSFYFYGITPGRYLVLTRRTPEGFTDELKSALVSTLLSGASTNHLRLELSDKAVLYANGKLAANRTIPPKPGEVGLLVNNCSMDSGIFEAVFDNFVVTELP